MLNNQEGPPQDQSTLEGAKRLKQNIERYWGDRGFLVVVTLVDHSFMTDMRSSWTTITSDMQNGRPIRKKPADDEQEEQPLALAA